MTLRKTLKNLREQNKKFYLVLWDGEDTVSIVRDTDIVNPPLDTVVIDSTVSVKVHRKMYRGKVAAIGSRDELTSVEKTYTEKRLNTIPEESSEELELDLKKPSELVTMETNSYKRDLEEPMESGSPFKRSRKDDRGVRAHVSRRKNATSGHGSRKPSSSAKLSKIANLEDHIYDVPIKSSTPKQDTLVSRPLQAITTTPCPSVSSLTSPQPQPVVHSNISNGLPTPLASPTTAVTPSSSSSSLVPPPLPPRPGKPAIPVQNGMGMSPQNVNNHQLRPRGLTQAQVRDHCLSCPPTPVNDWYKVNTFCENFSESPQSNCGVHGGSSGGDPSPAKMISDSDPLLLEITIMGIDSRVHKLEEQMGRIERNQNVIVQRLSNIETFCSQLYQFTQGSHQYPPPNPFYCTRL